MATLTEAVLMADSPITIHAPGVDVNAIIGKLRSRVADRIEKGEYSDARVARAERTNLAAIKDNGEFLTFYLSCLRDAVYVDIGDFEIYERRASFAPLLKALKRTIWSLLKFYTYRLWSQQNQVNGLLLSALEGTGDRCKNQIAELEARIARLESERSRRA
jgi:hypothetical protein